ncbi:MAG: hypothetical protein ACJ79H_12585 [Myxococcales bacterium]
MRNRALCRAKNAVALVRLGEIEEACAEATRAVDLAQQIDSARLADHLRAFDVAIAPWAAVPYARDYAEAVRLVRR